MSNMALHLGPLEDAAWIAWSASRARVPGRRFPHPPDRERQRTPRPFIVLFSGGNDSTTLATVMAAWGITRIAAHANTGIGVERTREHVRETCRLLGLRLHEMTPDPGDTYEDLVLAEGFPGPAMHFKMYQRLKERALRKVRALYVPLVTKRVVYIAGRRRQESARRVNVPLLEREGSVVWVSPIATWSVSEMNAIRDLFHVCRNPVSDQLGMSGECLCGAFADAGEYERIAEVDPESAVQISDLQDKARAAGVPFPRCLWGWGAYRDDPAAQGEQDVRTGQMCSSCDARRDPETRVADMFRPVPAVFRQDSA